jgi:hypothetical protein
MLYSKNFFLAMSTDLKHFVVKLTLELFRKEDQDDEIDESNDLDIYCDFKTSENYDNYFDKNGVEHVSDYFKSVDQDKNIIIPLGFELESILFEAIPRIFNFKVLSSKGVRIHQMDLAF